jgi:protein-S-isoprenylcysteine O-methyltransferase Ste14
MVSGHLSKSPHWYNAPMTIIPWIIIGCWCIFIGYWAISSLSVKRDISRSPWQRFWWLRVIVAAVVIGWLWGTSRLGKAAQYSWFSHLHSDALAALGAIICMAGIALAIWARVHIGRNWSSSPALKEDHELITSGPYSLIRHPIYTGVILATFGSTLASPAWLIMFFVVSALFIWRVHVEEALMIKQFPDKYPAYMKRTWALVPYIW